MSSAFSKYFSDKDARIQHAISGFSFGPVQMLRLFGGSPLLIFNLIV